MAQKKRRLTDLYVRGTEVTLDDGQGEPITVWVRKLSPIDHEAALRHANAARARVLMTRNDRESDEYLSLWGDICEYSTEDLLEYIALDEMAGREAAIEAELAAEEEWSEKDYLDGLQTAWAETLEEQYALDPTDPEAKACFDELKRFATLVENRLKREVESVKAEWENKPLAVLQEKALERTINMRASMAWLVEYRRCEVWRATYEEDKRTPYFTLRSEVDELSAEVFGALTEAYRNIAVEPLEGKGSQGTASSSSSSAAHDAAVMADSSGPMAVPA